MTFLGNIGNYLGLSQHWLFTKEEEIGEKYIHKGYEDVSESINMYTSKIMGYFYPAEKASSVLLKEVAVLATWKYIFGIRCAVHVIQGVYAASSHLPSAVRTFYLGYTTNPNFSSYQFVIDEMEKFKSTIQCFKAAGKDFLVTLPFLLEPYCYYILSISCLACAIFDPFFARDHLNRMEDDYHSTNRQSLVLRKIESMSFANKVFHGLIGEISILHSFHLNYILGKKEGEKFSKLSSAASHREEKIE